MIKYIVPLFLLFACSGPTTVSLEYPTENKNLNLTQKQAERLSALPLKCVQQEFPNKLGQVLNSENELKSPKNLHPAFYGCFDWHSSVHGHWLMIRLLKEFPDLKNRKAIRQKLNQQLTKQNILQEVAFFKTKFNDSFERTYGWAWILKLHEEMLTWNDKDAIEWTKNLQPLADLIAEKYIAFLPKLNYPIRTGEHINTAFGLTLAHDYAVITKNRSLKDAIDKRARYFYFKDTKSPLNYEPSGYDFLSPSIEEADLMRRVLSKSDFIIWFEKFLPQMTKKDFQWEPGKVSDRTDGKLVHLDGLNFSRAWCLYGIGHFDNRYKHLLKTADQHLAYSLPSIVDGAYMGEHWLATFAVYAMLERNKVNPISVD